MEDRATTRCFVKAHVATHPRDKLSHDAQPEAGASLLPRVRSIGLCEFLEDMALKVFRNAGAVVSHGNAEPAESAFDRDHDFGVPWREFDRVRQKISEDLHQPIRIDPNLAGRRSSVE